MIRSDLSNKLIHFTRNSENGTALENFASIIIQKRLIGTSKPTNGQCDVICFSEAPIASLGLLVAQSKSINRYAPFGIMFNKEYLYNKGARPVIYQQHKEVKLLDDSLKYLHVEYDLSNPEVEDYTWEREWRIRATEVGIDTDEATLIIPNREIEEELKNENHTRNRHFSIMDLPIAERFDWHFIALEDLGYYIEI